MKSWLRHWRRGLAAVALLGFAPLLLAGPLPKVGDAAPLIEGRDQDGHLWKLADHLRPQAASPTSPKAVLLYFYPKDGTPGCTKEACGFRDQLSELNPAGVEVVGVSFDSPASHQQFISKYDLNFPLLADQDGKIAEAYGVRMEGKDLARRVSFLIGQDGKILHITDSPNAETHLAEVKAAVQRLRPASVPR